MNNGADKAEQSAIASEEHSLSGCSNIQSDQHDGRAFQAKNGMRSGLLLTIQGLR